MSRESGVFSTQAIPRLSSSPWPKYASSYCLGGIRQRAGGREFVDRRRAVGFIVPQGVVLSFYPGVPPFPPPPPPPALTHCEDPYENLYLVVRGELLGLKWLSQPRAPLPAHAGSNTQEAKEDLHPHAARERTLLVSCRNSWTSVRQPLFLDILTGNPDSIKPQTSPEPAEGS